MSLTSSVTCTCQYKILKRPGAQHLPGTWSFLLVGDLLCRGIRRLIFSVKAETRLCAVDCNANIDWEHLCLVACLPLGVE